MMNYNNMHACRVGFLILLVGFRVSSGQLNCYFGSSDQTKGTPNQSLNQLTCSAKYLHQMNLTDGSSINISYSLPELRNVSSEDAKFCLVFLHQNSKSDYVCDHDNVCQATGVRQKFRYKDQLGTIFCCQSDLCNTYNEATKEANRSSVCCTDSGVDSLCGRSRCANETTVAVNGTTHNTFGCANESNFDPDFPVMDECHETISSVGRVTTCFCTGNHCNRPAAYRSSPATLVTTHPALLLYVTPSLVSQEEAKSWGFIGTITAVVLLVVLVVALVAFVARRFREHRAQHVTYTYTQLTADLAEERDTDDEYMLIG